MSIIGGKIKAAADDDNLAAVLNVSRGFHFLIETLKKGKCWFLAPGRLLFHDVEL